MGAVSGLVALLETRGASCRLPSRQLVRSRTVTESCALGRPRLGVAEEVEDGARDAARDCISARVIVKDGVVETVGYEEVLD